MKRILLLTSAMLVLFGCSESDGVQGTGSNDDKVAVSFVLPGIRAEVAPAVSVASSRAAGDVVTEPFDEGVTVRVAAFRRAGTTAALASDTFVDDGTYMAVKEDDEIVLKPCTVAADAPVTPLLNAALALGANTGEYTFPSDTFAELNESTKYLSAGYDEVLPKSKGTFDLSMNVTFNDGDPTDLTAEVPELAFAPGYQYNFNLKLIGNLIELELIVTSWVDVPGWDTEFGNPSISLIVTVGSWEIVGWDTTIGGGYSLIVGPGSWTVNPAWSTEFGNGKKN